MGDIGTARQRYEVLPLPAADPAEIDARPSSERAPAAAAGHSVAGPRRVRPADPRATR